MGWPGGQEIDRVQTAPRSCCLRARARRLARRRVRAARPRRRQRVAPARSARSSPPSAPSRGPSTATSAATRSARRSPTCSTPSWCGSTGGRRNSSRGWPSRGPSSPDGLTYTLKLRPGVTFSDGAPFTSADVLFSFQAVYDEKTGSPLGDCAARRRQAAARVGARPGTVVVRFPSPFGPGLRLLDNLPILPRHKLEAALDRRHARDGVGPGHAAGGDRRASARSS